LQGRIEGGGQNVPGDNDDDDDDDKEEGTEGTRKACVVARTPRSSINMAVAGPAEDKKAERCICARLW